MLEKFRKSKNKRYVVVLLLCFFLGGFGVHRFYVGKIFTGILQLLTLGGFGVWWLLDFLKLGAGDFTDKYGDEIQYH